MKIRQSLVFALSCFSLVVFGFGSASTESDESPIENPVENSIKVPDSECNFKCEDFKALERKNCEQDRIIEELKEEVKILKEKSFQEIESLSKKFDELKSEILSEHGLWILTPPLRGPPGPKGDQGPPGKDGERGGPDYRSLQNCRDAVKVVPAPRSKKQTIYPHGSSTSIQVLCDFEIDGGGWTIIQKRSSGPKHEFDRGWKDYVEGFGSLEENFWLGLENIHALTKNGDQELRIELEDFEGRQKWAKYSNFSISDASDFYRLSISGFSGNTGDSMTDSASTNNGMRFTTKGADHCPWDGGNCAETYFGSWWANDCGYSGLNGLYFARDEDVPRMKGILWQQWKGAYYSLAKTEMKIRQRK